MDTMMDTVTIYGIEFFGHHGVFESEKQQGQIFSVDCSFTLDTSSCNDNLDLTVNYGEVSLDIVDFCKNRTYDLLETLVNELAKYLLVKYKLMKSIKLTVHKPDAPIQTKFRDVTVTITRKKVVAYLSIGSNLGDTKAYLDSVSDAINQNEYITELAKSDYIVTKPYGVTNQPDFLNAALKVETIYTPVELLEFCHKLEHNANRVKKRHWGERTLDVDIVLYGNEIIYTDDLKIPHPEMHLREFVLKPLVQIDPYLIHPVKKENVRELLEKLQNQ